MTTKTKPQTHTESQCQLRNTDARDMGSSKPMPIASDINAGPSGEGPASKDSRKTDTKSSALTATARKVQVASARTSGNFTPGPWKAETAENGRPKGWLVTGPGLCYIASVDDQGAPDDNEANARLIAAAPDLLEACKMSLLFRLQEASDHPMAYREIKAIRAAIAKAEGRKVDK